METNKDIEQLLLSIQKAFDVLVEKRTDFEAKDVKEALQGSVKTQTTLLSFVDEHISELSTHEGIDMSKSSVWTYRKIRKNLAEFIGEKYRLTDLAFGQLTGKLEALSPLKVLERGYAIVRSEKGSVLRKRADAKPGESFSVVFNDGESKAKFT